MSERIFLGFDDANKHQRASELVPVNDLLIIEALLPESDYIMRVKHDIGSSLTRMTRPRNVLYGPGLERWLPFLY